MTLKILLFENAGKPFNVLINLCAMGTAKTQMQQCTEQYRYIEKMYTYINTIIEKQHGYELS